MAKKKKVTRKKVAKRAAKKTVKKTVTYKNTGAKKPRSKSEILKPSLSRPICPSSRSSASSSACPR